MSAHLLLEDGISQRPQVGPLGNFIPAFISLLSSEGYTPASIRSKTQSLRNFSLWIGKRQIKVYELDEAIIDAFFKQHYNVHANLQMKERALAKTVPLDVSWGKYRPDDQLLSFLKSL